MGWMLKARSDAEERRENRRQHTVRRGAERYGIRLDYDDLVDAIRSRDPNLAQRVRKLAGGTALLAVLAADQWVACVWSPKHGEVVTVLPRSVLPAEFREGY